MKTSNEPVLTTATITAILGLVTTGLAVWGLELTKEQTAWLAGVVAVVAPLLSAAVARRKVSPVAGVIDVQGRHEAT